MWMLLLSSFFLSLSFIWSLPFLLITLFKWQLYQIKEKEKVMLVSSKVRHSSIKKDDEKPSGVFVGYIYIGIFIDKEQSSEILLLCSIEKFAELTAREKIDNQKEEEIEEITLYERSGNFFWLIYSKRNFDVTNYIIREKQEPIIDSIIDYYNNKKFCTSLVYGQPGSGKSMISILIAKKLKGTLVRTFNPSEPGDSISSLYNQVSPTKNKPLIIVFDEVDIMMDKIYNNKIVQHKHIPIEIQDKSSWNRFFDDINLGLYPYVILVLTSNTFANNIETKYDSSYIRDGRVHIKCEL